MELRWIGFPTPQEPVVSAVTPAEGGKQNLKREKIWLKYQDHL
jgi:hypothetical protein